MKHERITIPGTLNPRRERCAHDFQHSPVDYVAGQVDKYRCTRCGEPL